MTSYTFVHEARPKVKERPRSSPNGRQLYTPASTLEAQAALAACYDGPLFEGPIWVDMVFRADRTQVVIEDWHGDKSSLRGDLDNYSKLVLDALQGIAYANDRQVMYMTAVKCK